MTSALWDSVQTPRDVIKKAKKKKKKVPLEEALEATEIITKEDEDLLRRGAEGVLADRPAAIEIVQPTRDYAKTSEYKDGLLESTDSEKFYGDFAVPKKATPSALDVAASDIASYDRAWARADRTYGGGTREKYEDAPINHQHPPPPPPPPEQQEVVNPPVGSVAAENSSYGGPWWRSAIKQYQKANPWIAPATIEGAVYKVAGNAYDKWFRSDEATKRKLQNDFSRFLSAGFGGGNFSRYGKSPYGRGSSSGQRSTTPITMKDWAIWIKSQPLVRQHINDFNAVKKHIYNAANPFNTEDTDRKNLAKEFIDTYVNTKEAPTREQWNEYAKDISNLSSVISTSLNKGRPLTIDQRRVALFAEMEATMDTMLAHPTFLKLMEQDPKAGQRILNDAMSSLRLSDADIAAGTLSKVPNQKRYTNTAPIPKGHHRRAVEY